MNSRDIILQRIRGGLSTGVPSAPAGLPTSAARPPVPSVWPHETSDLAVLAERFTCELQEVHGEILRCPSLEQGRQKLGEVLAALAQDAPPADESGQAESRGPIGAMDHPFCREIAAGLDGKRIVWAQDDWGPDFMARLPAGLVAAEHLLADTGSAVVACRTQQERLLCYLPPLCIVVARTEQLCQHMPAAWEAIVARCCQGDARGELLIITGPSRTADIEKILILGAHGPKRLVLLLVG